MIKVTYVMLMTTLGLSPAMGQTLNNHIDNDTIDRVGVEFKKEMATSGMSGVSAQIQACYLAIPAANTVANERATSECMLYDISAYEFDQGMQKNFVAQGMQNPEPATPFLSTTAFNARMQIYSTLPFGSVDAAALYFGDAPSDVINMVAGN